MAEVEWGRHAPSHLNIYLRIFAPLTVPRSPPSFLAPPLSLTAFALHTQCPMIRLSILPTYTPSARNVCTLNKPRRGGEFVRLLKRQRASVYISFFTVSRCTSRLRYCADIPPYCRDRKLFTRVYLQTAAPFRL